MIIFEKSNIDYLYQEIYPNNELKVLHYDFYMDIPKEHIMQFCLENGIYCLPTIELIKFLRKEIGEYSAIEIGAGHGAISSELGIVATDSRLQERPDIRMYYEALNQGITKYGDNIQQYEAVRAVNKFKPDVVVAAWVTHWYNPREHWRGGNWYGVKEHVILDMVKKYIFIGNKNTHKNKPILIHNHRVIESKWLISRVMDGNDVIWIWDR